MRRSDRYSRCVICALVSVAGLAADERPRSSPADPAEPRRDHLARFGYDRVPVTRQPNGSYTLRVRLQGQPLDLYVDSGIGSTTVNQNQAEALKLRLQEFPIDPVRVPLFSGMQVFKRRLRVADNVQFEFAKGVTVYYPVAVEHFPRWLLVGGKDPVEVSGCLGMNMIDEMRTVLDCRAEALWLLRPERRDGPLLLGEWTVSPVHGDPFFGHSRTALKAVEFREAQALFEHQDGTVPFTVSFSPVQGAVGITLTETKSGKSYTGHFWFEKNGQDLVLSLSTGAKTDPPPGPAGRAATEVRLTRAGKPPPWPSDRRHPFVRDLARLLAKEGYRPVPLSHIDSSLELFTTATVEGHEGRFLVDTGTNRTVLSTRFAERHGLKTSATDRKASLTDGRTLPIRAHTVKHFRVGDVEAQDTPLDVVDLSWLEPAGRPVYDGIIGADTLHRFGAVLDFWSQTLFLRPKQ
jgi:predicted aspartyl protease